MVCKNCTKTYPETTRIAPKHTLKKYAETLGGVRAKALLRQFRTSYLFDKKKTLNTLPTGKSLEQGKSTLSNPSVISKN
ncbi:hypothetical protein [Peribacillus sp. R9-11]|uniref:hypothetical protein n=1 Tax=Peribacillus sp. R9-11 TaxID=3073271 RepID=UPI002868C1DA|nr:hypothetical protein [Peribacillus sp. R9-11]WMX55644.1 hypothetical protein RE409_27150 [Peribacillus sp. R9-11]